ncbi:hypothetical protein [Methanobacterium oryzae]|uniref:hypothetical protein n=1 Tax=Methanobacterium oryzae TaxID=69540 RepID=UPI003D21B9B3
MKLNSNIGLVQEIMREFASLTGLEPVNTCPKRYLWTDAFAVSNYLELFEETDDKTYLNLALRLVDQVHHVLGRHRDDDPRDGWISGLDEEEGELHPTKGGLRIGKKMNERKPDEISDERLEWDQDGQYYHYITKWMHALNRVSKVTNDPKYVQWAVELGKNVHEKFTYVPSPGRQKRMYWKMSIDLSYPLVPSMGQHDPLDGFVTYNELQITANKLGLLPEFDLSREIEDMKNICQGKSWTTNDPLGIGGLLSDALRVSQLIINCDFRYTNLLETILSSALFGMKYFERENSLKYSANYRLAFRELGLSIGLKGVNKLSNWIDKNKRLFSSNSSLQQQVETLTKYVPIGESIEKFWRNSKNRETESWREHQEINMVMLVTSIIPEGFWMI